MNIFDLVKEVPILEVAKDLGIKIVKETSVNAFAVCPFHEDHVGGGGKANLSLLKTANGFRCFKCGENGTVVDFYAKACKVEPLEAAKALAAKYHIQDPLLDQPKPHPAAGKAEKKDGKAKVGAKDGDDVGEGPSKPKKLPKEPWDLARVQKAHARLMEPQNLDHLNHFCEMRKVDAAFVAQKKIGLDLVFGIDNDQTADLAYIIPVLAKDGSLLAIRTHSRLWRKHKKFIKGFTSKVFYDLTAFDPEAPELHIVEGEGDVWTLQHQLKRNVLTTMAGAGVMPSVVQEQMAVLGDLSKKTRIVFYPDNDDVGRECMARIRFLLPKELPCEKIYWPSNYGQKQDVSHWLNELGRTEQELDALRKTYTWQEAQDELIAIEKKKEQLEALKKLGIKVKEEANCYWRMKKSKEGIEWEPISNFVIRGKATIEIDGSAYTRADVITSDGVEEKDKQLPPEMWLGKRDFLRVFPHTKYRFLGSDNDIQQLKSEVIKTIPKDGVKKGVEIIGISGNHGDIFVGPGFAISKDGVIENPPFEYIRQRIPLEESFKLVLASDVKPILQEFCDNLLKINKAPVIVPTIGWMFACFFKERVRNMIQYFPLMSVFGTSGAGKTTFIQTMLRIFGIKKNTQLMNANTSSFTAMRMLACTNCIPLAIDELKEDAGPLIIDFWKRHARSAYGGETETRGRQDLSVKSYTYKAPLLVVGETSILREKATIERTISIEPKLSDQSQETRDAFQAVKNLDLEALFPKIVQWVLAEGNGHMDELWNRGKDSLKAMELPTLPPRVWDNYVTVMFGIEAFQAFAKAMGCGFEVPQDLRREALLALVGEVLTVSKRTKMGFDDFVEALAIMAKDGIIKSDRDYVRKGEWLYLHLASCVAAFRKWARDTRHDGDVLGKKEYRNQAREITNMPAGRYVIDCDKVWRFGDNTFRCVQLSLRRAERAGLDVSGFGFSAAVAPNEWETPLEDRGEEFDQKTELPPEMVEESDLFGGQEEN